MHTVTRRSFVRNTALWLGCGLLVHTFGNKLLAVELATTPQKTEKPPRLDLDIVKEFVVVSHSDLARVKELHIEYPSVINATHDFGGGDFETALGAASHTGQKEIARYLLENGARIDIFCATMFGMLDVVQRIIEQFPDMKHTKGPHGLSLLHHAKKGENPEMIAYIESISG